MEATVLDSRLLAAFVAVAESSSFSKAAKQLGLTKSTVSRAVAQLEALTGVELLHRTTRRVALSTAGTALFERTAPHLSALSRALEELPERREQPSGDLRVTAPHDVAANLLAELIVQFALRYPAVRVELKVTNARIDLVGEQVDVAIRAGRRLADSTLKGRRLGSMRIGVYAAPSYLARRGEPRLPGDPRHDWVMMPSMVSFLKTPKAMRPRFLVDDILTLRALLVHGGGVGLLPRAVAEPAVAAGSLQVVLPDVSPEAGHLYVLFPSSGQVSPKVKAFVDFISERLRPRLVEAR